jgi:IS30 family transposase
MSLKTYFTSHHTSSYKVTVENRIGVIRRFLHKKTNPNFVTDRMIAEIERKINNRRVRKCKYMTTS